jgi:hypothetical protein
MEKLKLNDLIAVLDGRENMELHIDGKQFQFTSANARLEWMEREVESVRIDPKIYLGLIIRVEKEVMP